MTIKRCSSISNHQGVNSKRVRLSADEYQDLNELLSDSDGWEDESHPLVEKNKDEQPRNKVRTEFSDEDDSIIYRMFDNKKSCASTRKILVGASHKQAKDLKPRNSFSSLISERPIVESTQRANQLDSIEGDDSKLLISILKGEEMIVSPRDNLTAEKNLTILNHSKSNNAHGTVNAKVQEEKFGSIIGVQNPKRFALLDVFALPKADDIKPDQMGSEKTHVTPGQISEVRKESAPRESPEEEDDDLCIIEERKDICNLRNQKESYPPDVTSKSANISDSTSEDEISYEVIKGKKKMQYAEKFALLTQRPCLQDLQELDGRLKLRPSKKVVVPLRLSKEQEDVLRLAEEGHNIFYTGSAGTGKSVLLREMIKVLKRMYGNDQVAITASTGLAACNVGGITVHSFAGVGLGNGDVKKLYQKVKRSQKFVKRWQNISALVVDEISMLDGELLDKLDFIAQKIRKSNRPFGDIQLIFCGDFFQLPPVSKDQSKPTKFAFESSVWKDAIDVTIALKKVFRQQGDTKFIDMLNKLRLGRIDGETEAEFKKLSRALPDDDIIPAELYSTRNEVDRSNNSRLGRLPGKVHTYQAIDGGILQDNELKEKLLQNFLAPKQLQLKIGAQVMMIKNIDATLVNGSLGKVVDFLDHQTYMFYETMRENPDIGIEELERLQKNPDILKETWNGNSDEPEVAVRQKSSKDAFCRSDPDASKCELGESIFDFLQHQSPDDTETRFNLERKEELLRQIHESSRTKRKLPLVRFKTSDMSTRTVLVEPEDWAIEDENEKPLVSRVQLPLMLAWSLSIHKSQGQTLPKVKVDLRRVFEKGQAYVALSRAVSREGLQVLNFDKSRIMAHQKVVDFYSTLLTVDEAMKRLKEKTSTRRRGGTVGMDLAPTKPFITKRTRQAKSKSGTPNPAGGIDRITEMLMRRNNCK